MPARHLTLDEVRHVARLSRLAVPEEKLERYADQLETILGYIDKLAEVDTSGVEPLAHALPIQNVFRDDAVGAVLSVEAVLQNAPETDGPFFKVPKIIGADDSAG